jgi:uncharacterized membrane protein (TIGR02234 family)
LLPVVAAGLASAALAAVAGNQEWARLEGGDAADAAFSSAVTAADATAPPVTALALVLLATWGVVLVVRGLPRRALTWFGLVAAVGVLGFAVAAWLGTPDALAAEAVGEQVGGRTFWAYVGVLAAVVALAASAAGVRGVRHWPEMGRRYDAPGEQPAAPAAGVPVEEQTNLDLWRAIDEGRDPTAGSTP